jgi:SAM-dependent methyltransferase
MAKYNYGTSDEFPAKHYKTLIDTLHSFEIALFEPLYNQEHYDSGHWDFVSYNLNWFLMHITEAHAICDMLHNYDKEKHKFIDVGCGIGTKVALASELFDAHGIELDKSYAKIARKLTKKKQFYNFGRYDSKEENNPRIKITDALQYPDYDKFDVIYFFRPLNKVEMEVTLELKIFRDVKKNTLIIPIYSQSDFPNYITKLNTPNGNIFIKNKNEEEVNIIQKRVAKLFKGKKNYTDF